MPPVPDPDCPDVRGLSNLSDDELARLVAQALTPSWSRPTTPTPDEARLIVQRAHERIDARRQARLRTAGQLALAVISIVTGVRVTRVTPPASPRHDPP